VVVIDTDVVLLAFAFQNDLRQSANTNFLNKVRSAEPAITIYNLMEILGQLSFNLSPAKLANWQSWLIDAYQFTVIWPMGPDEQDSAAASFRAEIFDRPFAKMRARRMAFMDALVLNLAERTPEVHLFVTWNARHFKDKSSLAVLTPEEYSKQAI
jgi:hypothetical protein